MTAEQIRVLDHGTTAVILPGGILEQHGPHLPVFADGYMNQVLSDSLAAAIARRPGWKALVFPMIPLGAGGANEIGGHYVWPGSYGVRTATLRAIFMDLATELGEQEFQWVFVVHGHGSPWHNQALDQAGDYFRDTYGGHMVNLTGIEPDWEAIRRGRAGLVSAEVLAEDANSVHAGLSETSRILYIRPDLVSPTVREVPSITAPVQEIVEVARTASWPGYFGAPRHASAALGRADLDGSHGAWIDIAMRILDGADERTMPRYVDMMLAIPLIHAIGEGTARYDSTVAERQEAWFQQHAQD
jgi:creatinine amidohydrolase/Fe(II)-dependent formamide hydrolase-like protein